MPSVRTCLTQESNKKQCITSTVLNLKVQWRKGKRMHGSRGTPKSRQNWRKSLSSSQESFPPQPFPPPAFSSPTGPLCWVGQDSKNRRLNGGAQLIKMYRFLCSSIAISLSHPGSSPHSRTLTRFHTIPIILKFTEEVLLWHSKASVTDTKSSISSTI